jgi:hypothetical protein
VNETAIICAPLQVNIVAVPGPLAVGTDVVKRLLLVAVIVLFTVSIMVTPPVAEVVTHVVVAAMIIGSAVLLDVGAVLHLPLVKILLCRLRVPSSSSGITLLDKAI